MSPLYYKSTTKKMLKCASGKIAKTCYCGLPVTLTPHEINFSIYPGFTGTSTYPMSLNNLGADSIDWVGALSGDTIYLPMLSTDVNSGTLAGTSSQEIVATFNPSGLILGSGFYDGTRYVVNGVEPISGDTVQRHCHINVISIWPVLSTLWCSLWWVDASEATWAKIEYGGTTTYGGRPAHYWWKGNWAYSSYGGWKTGYIYLFTDGLSPMTQCRIRASGYDAGSDDNWCEFGYGDDPYPGVPDGYGIRSVSQPHYSPWEITFEPYDGQDL